LKDDLKQDPKLASQYGVVIKSKADFLFVSSASVFVWYWPQGGDALQLGSNH